ncbi:MAG: acyl-CoA dehydrogenase family protein, partial [Novosphingobium sp.]
SLIGEGDLHEVFFDDVVVPVDARLGEEGQAWEITTYSLTNERLGIARYELARKALDRAVTLLKGSDAFSRDMVRAEAARCASLCEAARIANYALVQQRTDGRTLGGEASSARFATIMAEREVCAFVVEFVPEALADASPFLKMHHQRGIAAGIAAGSAEIQLNIIATEVLQLPREPR